MKQEHPKSYVSINPYTLDCFQYENGIVKKTTPRFLKKNSYISFLNTKDFIVTQIDISKNIPPEDIRDVIELKAYEELDLDQTVEYKIEYVEFPGLPSDKDRHFNVFLTEPKIIEETFEQVTKSIPYIDIIVPAPLLFRSLYTNDVLESEHTDLFIYFQRNDAFLTLYSQGNMIYAKSIKYSFEDIAQRLSELTAQDISAQEVMETLAKDGLKMEDLDKLQFYMQVFSELFMHINDILIYAKRANEIEIIDHIYISSEIGFIKGIEEYSQTYLTQEAYDFSFEYPFEIKERYIEPLHNLMLLTAIDIYEKGFEYPNFSIFPRPAPFFKRPSGELTLIVAASLLLGFAYPLYNFALGYKYKYEASVLEEKYPKIHAQKVSLETRINALKKQLEEIKQKVAKKKSELEQSQKILQAIYDKKVNYVMKSVTVADLSQDLVRHKLLLQEIDNNASTFDLNVTSTDDKSITKFIKYISDNKYNRYDIATKEITKTDPKSNVYRSRIEVKVK